MATIQWFPGHMAKARREMTASLKQVDAVLELVDSRLPEASRNPLLDELIQSKPRIIVMTRTDLADPVQTEAWVSQYRQSGIPVVGVDAKAGQGMNRIVDALHSATREKREKQVQRGIRPRPIRSMVVGIPNVGKSSLINRLARKSVAKTGDKPGITKAQQWIRIGAVELLDTPGVLWPKFDDEHVAYRLAVSGAIKSDILDTTDVCSYFILWCSRHYPELLSAKYGVTDLPNAEWTGSAEAITLTMPVLEAIAKRRGLLAAGGVANIERAADAVLRDVQTGGVGRLSFEWAHETIHEP